MSPGGGPLWSPTDGGWSDRLEALNRAAMAGRLAGGVARGLATPLSMILAQVRLLRRSSSDEQFRDDLETIEAQVSRVSEAAAHLVEFGRVAQRPRPVVSIAALLARAIRSCDGLARDARVTVELRPGAPDAGVPLDVRELQLVVVNLVVNAIDAQPDGGAVRIRADLESAMPPARDEVGSWVAIRVEDDGPGMSAAVAREAFAPFFSTREPNLGGGIGLTVCRGIVERAGGWIEITRAEPGGTIVAVFLPPRPTTDMSGR